MSTAVIERVPDLDYSPPIDMPPMDIVKCQCEESCPQSGPCDLEATDDDLLCTPCRKAAERRADYLEWVAGRLIFQATRDVGNDSPHCHLCDPEFEDNNKE
jgi:hypothetical protein